MRSSTGEGPIWRSSMAPTTVMSFSVPTAAISSAMMSSVRSIGRFPNGMPRSAQIAAMISTVMLSMALSLAGGVVLVERYVERHVHQRRRALQAREVARHRQQAEPPVRLPEALQALEHVHAALAAFGRDVEHGLAPRPHLAARVDPLRLLQLGLRCGRRDGVHGDSRRKVSAPRRLRPSRARQLRADRRGAPGRSLL